MRAFAGAIARVRCIVQRTYFIIWLQQKIDANMQNEFPTLQAFPPRAAHLCLEVARFLERDLGLVLQNQSFLVGYSGGIDSTALLYILHGLRSVYSLQLTAIHINHNLRESAAEEAEHCRSVCATLEIPCLIESVDVVGLQQDQRIGMEEAARVARYRIYASAMENGGCHRLVLAHQLNDLAEDVLMRLMRGTGWPALGGMCALDERRKLVRPLLLIPRAALEELLHTLAVPYIIDPSNEDMEYFRNRVRKEFLPLFMRENPSFLSNIANLWKLGTWDAELFTSLLQGRVVCGPGAAEGEVLLKNEDIAGLARSMRLRLYMKYTAGHTPFSSLVALDTAWVTKKRGKVILLGQGHQAIVRRDGIVWKTQV